MRIIYSNSTNNYRLKHDFSDGAPPFAHPERPERCDAVLRGIRSLGFDPQAVTPPSYRPILQRIHDNAYLAFLQEACEQIPAGEEWIPTIMQPRQHTADVPVRFRLGAFCREIGTPLTAQTYLAALCSFNLACEGATRHDDTGEDVFVITRPPGHHAGVAHYGGYCFFNNCVGAAHALPGTTAILDIDYHIGDGTLEHLSPTLRYASLHADPVQSYPYRAFAAADHPHARLIALARDSTREHVLAALDALMAQIDAWNPDHVVVALGFDTLGADGMQDMPLPLIPDDLAVMGARLAHWRGPKVYVLEGGYDAPSLEAGSAAFFRALRKTH